MLLFEYTICHASTGLQLRGHQVRPWMSGSKLISCSFVLVAALMSIVSGSVARADDVIRFGAPLPLTGPLAPEGDQAAAGLRPLGRAGQQGRRHFGRRQEIQGRDRLRGLSVQHAALGADHRADDHPGQHQLPVRARSARAPPRPPAPYRKNTRCRPSRRRRRRCRSTTRATNICSAPSRRTTR